MVTNLSSFGTIVPLLFYEMDGSWVLGGGLFE